MEKQDWLDIVDIMGKKDLLDIADIIIIPIILALLALLWPGFQNRRRCRIFTKLIIRELSEIAPYTEPNKVYRYWTEHCQKKFIHKEIFHKPNENRDFVLSLEPDLVYYISQLWDSFDKKNAKQWWFYLQELTLFIEYYHPFFRKQLIYLPKQLSYIVENIVEKLVSMILSNYSKKYKNDIYKVYYDWFDLLENYYYVNKTDFKINTKNKSKLEEYRINLLNKRLEKFKEEKEKEKEEER